MYRVLAANQPVRERRNQREHPQYAKPELVATGSNQTWSWDVTKLLGPKKWTYFYLYVLLDIFSRYVVGWMVADRENSALAGRLIEETCHKQGVEPQVLTLHSDRGAPMTSQCTAQLLADLGVTRSLSRPQVSDDNPFSEAQFKTLKYHPGFPGRFHDIDAAITFCRTFFPWYHAEHRHGGIAMLTPDDVHHGRAQRGNASCRRTRSAVSSKFWTGMTGHWRGRWPGCGRRQFAGRRRPRDEPRRAGSGRASLPNNTRKRSVGYRAVTRQGRFHLNETTEFRQKRLCGFLFHNLECEFGNPLPGKARPVLYSLMRRRSYHRNPHFIIRISVQSLSPSHDPNQHAEFFRKVSATCDRRYGRKPSNQAEYTVTVVRILDRVLHSTQRLRR